MEPYFLDSYALYELFVGNSNYKRFEKNVAVITTKLNLMEFFYTLLRLNAEKPEQYYDRLLHFVVEISDDVIKRAMRFRFKNRSKNLSYVDALGYVLALEKKAVFVTGDEQFRNLEKVEFIK